MKKLIFSALMLLFLCGCSAPTQLKDRTVVAALCFERENGECRISALCLKSAEDGAEKLIVSSAGESPFIALERLIQMQKNIYFGHLSAIFLSSEAAKTDANLICQAISEANIPERSGVYLCRGEPSELLTAELRQSIDIAEEIDAIEREDRGSSSFFILRRSLAGGEPAKISAVESYSLGDGEEGQKISLRIAGHADIEP